MDFILGGIRFLASRVIKFFANVAKAFFLLHHYLRPAVRFQLPHSSPALLRSTRTTAIPRVIWQTNYTDRVTLAVYANYLFNRMMAPTYEYRFCSDAERQTFIAGNFPPEVSDSYTRLTVGAARADLWRVLLLAKEGGVYLDIDAHLVWPLEWIIHRDWCELFVTDRFDALTNHFIAAGPGSKHLQGVARQILENISASTDSNVWSLTGPGAMQTAVDLKAVRTESYRVVCHQGNFTNEYLQYIDHPFGKWHKQQQQAAIVSPSGAAS